MVDIYCSATNRFISGQPTEPSCKAIFSSSWTRAPELLTARSALACVRVPRGEIFWGEALTKHCQVTMNASDMMCHYFDFLISRWPCLVFCLTNNVWTQTCLYCLTLNTVLWTCLLCTLITWLLNVTRGCLPYPFCPELTKNSQKWSPPNIPDFWPIVIFA